jgi:hypothetical protein
LALALLPLWSAVGCGVQEHPHDQPDDLMSVGGQVAPPPPTPEGGSPSATGGVTGVTGGTTASGGASSSTGGVPGNGSGGVLGSGGATSSGGVTAQGGVTSMGGASTTGGGPSSGGMVGSTGGASSGGTGNGGTVGTGGAVVSGGAVGSGGKSTGGSSGVTVNINGTVIPKESVIAFIHLGHSNMAGRSTTPSASRPYHFTETNLRGWIYRAGNWTPALEPNTAGDADGKRANAGGPGTAMLKEAIALAPTRYFVSLGYGIGSAYCSQFLRGGLYYDQVMAAPLALKGKVTFGAIVIMLGITERHGTSADISGYSQCINKLVTAIRTDLAEPNLPLLITDYEMGATGSELSPTGTFAKQIIPQIQMIPSVVSNSALVPTDGVAMQDDHHFNLDGQKTWAQRVLSVMKTKGWFPW